MPRDQKIGLALGILLVGAVAAFFFRHDQTQIPPLPALKTAAELDRQIATFDRTPYLQSDEPILQKNVPPVTDAVMDEEFPEPQDGAGLVPDPIAGSDELTLADPAAPKTPTAPVAPPRSTEHQVQRGETLSSIAAKYLGSANRYDELFRANADQLRDPNDVQPGMTLRIPEANKPAGTPSISPERQMPSSSDIAAGPAQPLSSNTESKRFVPYSRSPLQVPEANSLDTDPKAAAKRRLTLTPPRDGSVIR